MKKNSYFVIALLIHLPSSRSFTLTQHTEAFLKSGDFTEASNPCWSPKGSQRLTKQRLCRSDHTGGGFQPPRIHQRRRALLNFTQRLDWGSAEDQSVTLLTVREARLLSEAAAGQRAVARRIKPAVFPWKTATSGVLMTLTRPQPSNLRFWK